MGSLRLASSPERWSEICRSLSQARSFGFEAHEVAVAEAKRLFPYLATEGIVGAVFIPSDGYVDPNGLTQAYAKGARAGGVRILEGVAVTGAETAGRRVTALVTDDGTIRCETVVVCAGLWARKVGALLGVALAAGVVQHQYLVTGKSLKVPSTIPTLRDPDHNVYLKPDVGGFAFGGWEHDAPPCFDQDPPFAFGRTLFDSDFDRFAAIAQGAATRVPAIDEAGVQTLINGPIPVSADGEPIMGLAPERDNVFVACGFTAGIAASGGAGLAMANWIVDGDPGMDLWSFDARRFGPLHAGRWFLEARAVEAYGRYYAIHWPNEEMESARDVRLSPLHGALAAHGAVCGAKFGWERPNWFAARDPSGAVEAHDRPSFEGRPNWFDAVGAEHRAVRERVALIDQTSFTKFEVAGPGALGFLQRVAANDVAATDGRNVVYTQLCNERGGIEADLTVMRLEEDRFMVVTGAGFGVRDRAWLTAHMPRDGTVSLRDVSGALAVINLCGPRSREVLARVAEEPVDDAALPFRAARTLTLGSARALAARIGYVGERGYEIYVPVEVALHLHDALCAAGAPFGIADAGYRAIESLRLEKGYLYWSAELSPDVNPYEAGLGFCVALDKGEFVGRAALARLRAEGPRRVLCSFTLEPDAPVIGGEAIVRDGRVLGTTTSAGYGYTVGRAIAFGYLPREEVRHADFEIEAYGRRVAVTRLGSLTNRVYRLEADGARWCLRVPGKGTEAYIDRKVEVVNARAAATAGVSPEVLFFDESDGLMVTRFIDGITTMTPATFPTTPGAPTRAGRAFRDLHRSGVAFAFRFELFSIIDGYLAHLAKLGARLPDGYHDVVREAEGVRAALAAHPVPLAPCHCDPLCENFLDDGARMWIVDWEYSGMNHPMWDLGDLSVEAGFGPAQDQEMLRAYFGTTPSAFDTGCVVIYKAMCDLLWTLWGLIQDANKNPVDDFWAYANNRFVRCKALMADPVFAGHVAAVRAG
ncbi:MAG: FAD-dependent oxidoreductase [Alphaproteobacteria bacterium]|nr:FAD-dependent oxidoreductase [Alphaproteobacteria bacterium]